MARRYIMHHADGVTCRKCFLSEKVLEAVTTASVNFSQVNMPLLRLLHQISSMYQNARATQIGLREQRPMRGKDSNLPTHHKEGSYSGVTKGNVKKR